MSGRDSTTGRIVPDPTKFPDGIDGLATKIHDLGLKIGIYRYVYKLLLMMCSMTSAIMTSIK